MTFKLTIRGRDCFPLSPAANPANPLIGGESEMDFAGLGPNDETAQDLVQHTISRLAGLAGRAIEKEDLPYGLKDVEREQAGAYHQHHFSCRVCCAAGQRQESRCAMGADLWMAYQRGADDAVPEIATSSIN